MDQIQPSPDLARFVSVAWTMEWNFPDGQSLVQKVLPNPAVQIVISAGQAEIFGVVTGTFSTTLSGEGFVFALKFRPCGFRPFANGRVSAYTDRRLSVSNALPRLDPAVLQELARTQDNRALMTLLEAELRENAPKTTDPICQELESLIDNLERDANILTVDRAATLFGASSRTLQRLFHEYVGVGPKWIIRRYRLKEVAARIESGEEQNWAGLAQRLGYFDQAHLIRDFKKMTGETPAAYAKSTSG